MAITIIITFFDNQIDNRLTDVVIRLERLERLINNKADNKRQVSDDKPDNISDSQPSGEDWVSLVTIATQLDVLPKSISGVISKRGRDIGNDTIEFEVADCKIYKKGCGVKALYQLEKLG